MKYTFYRAHTQKSFEDYDFERNQRGKTFPLTKETFNPYAQLLLSKNGKARLVTCDDSYGNIYIGHFTEIPENYIISDIVYSIVDTPRVCTVGPVAPYDIETFVKSAQTNCWVTQPYQLAFCKEDIHPVRFEKAKHGEFLPFYSYDCDLKPYLDWCYENRYTAQYILMDSGIYAWQVDFPSKNTLPNEVLEKFGEIALEGNKRYKLAESYTTLHWENTPYAIYTGLSYEELSKSVANMSPVFYKDILIQKNNLNGLYDIIQGKLNGQAYELYAHKVDSSRNIEISSSKLLISLNSTRIPIKFYVSQTGDYCFTERELNLLELEQTCICKSCRNDYVILGKGDTGSQWVPYNAAKLKGCIKPRLYKIIDKAGGHGVNTRYYDSREQIALRETLGERVTRLKLKYIPKNANQCKDSTLEQYNRLQIGVAKGEITIIDSTDTLIREARTDFGGYGFLFSCLCGGEKVNKITPVKFLNMLITKYPKIFQYCCGKVYVDKRFLSLQGFLTNISQIPYPTLVAWLLAYARSTLQIPRAILQKATLLDI